MRSVDPVGPGGSAIHPDAGSPTDQAVVLVLVLDDGSAGAIAPTQRDLATTRLNGAELRVVQVIPDDLPPPGTLDGVDHVAVLRAGARLDPGWLAPLLQRLLDDPLAGSASPVVRSPPRYLPIVLRSDTFTPAGPDERILGVRVTAVDVDGADLTPEAVHLAGFHAPGRGTTHVGRWTDGLATLVVPCDDRHGDRSHITIGIGGPRGTSVTASVGDDRASVQIGPGATAVELDVERAPQAVTWSAGGDVALDGKRTSRPPRQDRPEPTDDDEVPIFGPAALLRVAFLEDVGLLDAACTDADAGRAIARSGATGWRHWCCPGAAVVDDVGAEPDWGLVERSLRAGAARDDRWRWRHGWRGAAHHVPESLPPLPAGTSTVDGSAGVCILGMHRSGTSALAGILQRAGLNLGDVRVADDWNPKGNRERDDVVGLHDELLRSAGGSWDRPPASVPWPPTALERARRLADELGAAGPWGFKDPRAVFTVEGWLEAVPGLAVIASVREPRAVAASLQRREGRDHDEWIGLWYLYNRRLLALAEQLDLHVVDFDQPVDRYRDALRGLIDRLGLDADGLGFYEPALRHGPAGTASGPALPPAVVDLHRQLLERSG